MHATRCLATSHHITSHYVALAHETDSLNDVSHLKWYSDENRIFPFQAILKHKKASVYEEQNAVNYFEISNFVPEIDIQVS